MKSEWKVQSNTLGGERHYIAYRINDTNQVVHSGNIENFGKYSTDRAEIEALVKELNEKEG